MAQQTSIEWTTATQNFWRGCDKVSPGCAHCYMFVAQERYGRDPSVVIRTSDTTFYAPIRSKKWRELPAGSMVFTCSWSDFFHEDADEWRDDAWDVIYRRPDLVWQILTKRPELIPGRLPSWWGDADCEAPDNVWLGVSIENRRFVHRADQLRAVPAAVRFISAEPLLGPLVPDLENRFTRGYGECWQGPELDLRGIDWLIVGGESGLGHRPMRLEWARDLVDACRRSGTAPFVKQLGGARPGTRLEDLPEDLRIREFPA